MKAAAILSCFLLLMIKGSSTTYYFSAAGNDLANGTSTATPFKTIVKLNTLILHPGDNILFRCGDVFRGQIVVDSSGTSANPITFSSYGTGEKPVISGASVITGWSFNSTYNCYEAASSSVINNFFLRDKEQMLARYPNNHRYLNLDTASNTSPNNYLQDADITSLSASWVTGSKLCVHTAQWCWEKASVSSLSGNQINYSPSFYIAPIKRYGYFLYDNILLLDTATEWKYSATDQKVYYKPGNITTDTSNCEGSVYNFGILLRYPGACYITIKGLAFEKQSRSGVMIGSANNRYIKIDSCYFARQYEHGVNDQGRYNETSNSYFREVDGIAVFVNDSATNATIHHNTFRNIGEFRNSGIGTEINLTAIKAAFVDSCFIHHNDIDSAGYCGISADGNYHIIEKNIIKNVMLVNNDGAALKTYGSHSGYNTFRNNFVSTSDGNTEGTDSGSFITPAIYFDYSAHHGLVQDNTVYGRTQKGIFMNSGSDSNTIIGNTVYGFNIGLDLNGSNQVDTAITGMNIKHNVFFARHFPSKTDTPAIVVRYYDYKNQFNAGLIDSNTYFHPYTSFIITKMNGPRLKLYSWRAATGFDLHTDTCSFTWADSAHDLSQLFINPTDNSAVQDLQGLQWKDLSGNIVSTLTLQPWTSKILYKTGVVLPVELISFNATKAGKDANCVWQTTSEQNVSYYNIQRSLNGRDFNTIGKVNAAGNSNVSNAYSFNDINAADLNASALYYRLQIVDKDTKTSYSPAVKLNWKNSFVMVYPNPANGFVKVDGENIQSIKLYDGIGKLVLQKNDCNSSNSINLAGLAKGVYTLSVISKDNDAAVQLLIVN
jgi:parallel beta-helix repeat protein